MSSLDRERNRSGKGPMGSASNADKPPNSRLFIICSKNQTESDLKDYFSQFGEVENVWLVKDKVTREPKGVAYVKFAKFSQAAKAMEDSDGKRVMNMTKPIKVIIANSRGSHSSKDIDEKLELTRLFVVVPNSFDDDELYKNFEEYGEIDHVTIITDKKTGANKGFGYVKFRKVSGAAKALENCDKGFKAVIAEPRKSEKRSRDDGYDREYRREDYDRLDRSDRSDYGRLDHGRYDHGRLDYGRIDVARSEYGRFSHSRPESDYPMRGEYTSPPPLPRAGAPPASFDIDSLFFPAGSALHVNVSPRLVADIVGPVSEAQIKALFGIVPGMEYCDYREEQVSWGYKGTAYIRYNTASQAAYAKQKLDNFEYPPGCPIQLKFVEDTSSTTQSAGSAYASASQPPACSVPLPPLQPCADPDSPVEERLFVICTRPLPEAIICDVFRRFGNFISYKNVHGRNYGYARFAKKESAEICLSTLHGHSVAGEKMKVLVADPEPEDRKRPRTT
ncbi:RNA-binding protein 45-like [Diadema antillarum]|uniref:RNA-binding protein 45-like n=1 Tax=Diadema antillarum TaxID=105358 RepID=UPI003A887252